MTDVASGCRVTVAIDQFGDERMACVGLEKIGGRGKL